MKEMKLCSISDKYIDFLREDFPNVYSNKETRRTHTRKYIGVVMRISEYLYYIPMSSPKDTDYQVAGARLNPKQHETMGNQQLRLKGKVQRLFLLREVHCKRLAVEVGSP